MTEAKKLLKTLGISAKEVASGARISEAHCSNVLSGKRPASLPTARKMGDAVAKRVGEIFLLKLVSGG